jgi:hypothetical protein
MTEDELKQLIASNFLHISLQALSECFSENYAVALAGGNWAKSSNLTAGGDKAID